jgi:hypothetical protein
MYFHIRSAKTNTSEKLKHYAEAAAEMEHRYNSTDDPAIRAANPDLVWRPAKVRAEAQMLAGAQTWDHDRPEWSAKNIKD